MPQLAAAGATALELGGGVLLLFGIFTRIGALLLILFLIPTTFIMHAFWNAPDAQQMNETIHFMKNLTILGGLFALMGLGGGAVSFDGARARRKARQRAAT